ncbi:myb-like DNA-binding domain-containing protein [Cryptosporidium muris RN66]|uniref:Myb-like DNA-binding domain-containing protein n=1 Tax=Cryptosporidium muris (strain RN66) TaxID=441375 RepID=B6AG81_CRYMR|nr:myb-like DNA-binding domain-containing protein [Cryptosporidium muris RN66]EEA07222.1 myb-like DNA-binding domain-containing protein [Cryptosporidium muris RN66]|eukprot:XP_002141571.1 myb-like DNA-binding domain-containing protein [Cryptosporidium muris RN66]
MKSYVDTLLFSRHWNDHLNRSSILKGKFSAAEREMINKTVKSYIQSQGWSLEDGLINLFCSKGGKRDRHWPIIGECLPNRSLQSIYYCAKRMMGSGKRGKWTKEEENELVELVRQYGTQWSKFSEIIGRSAATIRDKWRDLAPRLEYLTDNKLDKVENITNKEDDIQTIFSKSRFPLIVDVFMIYCIEYYTGKFLPHRGIPWKTILSYFNTPNFPIKFLKFWKKCIKYLKHKYNIRIKSFDDNDLSYYSCKLSEGQIRLRYVSTLYPKLFSINNGEDNCKFVNLFSRAVKYIYETREHYTELNDIKHIDWNKVLPSKFPLTNLWSRIRLAIRRTTNKNQPIQDRIITLYEKLQNKKSLDNEMELLDLSQSTVEDEEEYEENEKEHHNVDTKRLRRVITKLVQLTEKNERNKENIFCSSNFNNYSSLQKVRLISGNKRSRDFLENPDSGESRSDHF